MPNDEIGNRQLGVKISELIRRKIFDPTTSDLTLVVDNQNFKLSVQDLYENAGVIGTLDQLGDPANFPVLNNPAPFINEIRNLAPGAGISMKNLVTGDIEISVGITEGGANYLPVTQTQAFPLLAPLYRDFGAGDYKLAQANDASTADVQGVVIRTGSTDFILGSDGYYTLTHGLAVGKWYLSATTAGGITQTPPTLNNPAPGPNFLRELFTILDPTTVKVTDTPTTTAPP